MSWCFFATSSFGRPNLKYTLILRGSAPEKRNFFCQSLTKSALKGFFGLFFQTLTWRLIFLKQSRVVLLCLERTQKVNGAMAKKETKFLKISLTIILKLFDNHSNVKPAIFKLY